MTCPLFKMAASSPPFNLPLNADMNILTEAYNDLDLETDAGVAERLAAAGLPTELSRHFAHLFIRDPLVFILCSSCV